MASGRAERRKKTLDELKEAPAIIDLTNDDTSPSPAATRPQTIAPGKSRSSAKHRADIDALERAPAMDLTDDGWERLAVYPTSLRLELENGRCADDNGRIDVHSIAEVVIKPSIGYPATFHLFRDSRGGFTGKYGEDETGRISLEFKDVEAMIRQEQRDDGFFAFVSSPE
ncbi:hypothetical protein VTK26DRAFT_8938 [Humicola hyalothermophila]